MRLAPLALALVLFAGCAGTRPAAAPPASQAANGRGGAAKTGGPKPYAEVVTDEAVTDAGLFTVHRVGEKLLFEVPDSLMGRDLLSVVRIAQVPADLGGFIPAGAKRAEGVLRWERVGDRVLLRTQSYAAVADEALPIAQSVRVNNFEPVVAAFPVAAVAPDGAGVVVDVTDLYGKDTPALSGLTVAQRTRFKVRRLDEARSFVDGAKSFPENVNVRYTTTYDAAAPPSNAGTGTVSLQMFHSFVLLPREPMTARLADDRVGYFTVRQIDYGRDDQKAAEREYVRRWRLVPRDTAAYLRGELVEPVEPIVYTLDPATPERWRPYFCQGVEDWNRSFEVAGFQNAIRCEMPPAPGDSAAFDPEDVRYSIVRYVASETRNATGPSVSDPRSGEIIESDIIWYHNHIRSYRNRLMIETGAANPAARSLQIDEALIGETMRQVIAHEIGHALGLPHNMIASSAFPVDSLRSPTFTSEFGVAPTIMDYTRQNYVAQPGDGVTRFVRQIGPYDDYAINWAYRWYPDVATPDDETATLDALVAARAGDPVYRFSTGRGGYNPDAQTEDMGDDPVAASGYAVENLKRMVPNLVAWTSTPGEGYDDLAEIYGETLGMWRRYMGHVVTVVGGVRETPKASDQAGVVFEPVGRQEQERALAFLDANVFETPTWLLDPEILRRIRPTGAVDGLRRAQVAVLNGLLDPMRLGRLVEAEAVDGGRGGAAPYPLAAFMDDLRADVWAELDARRPAIDVYRRNLQRGYVERLVALLTEDGPDLPAGLRHLGVDVSQSDVRAAARGALRRVREGAEAGAGRTRDAATRDHLLDVAARVDAAFDAGGRGGAVGG
ncbi:zinc-dependent metalloprotease [Rubrivirga litoralis]|uniref:Zinc-dependent metalloprotease n=1 Tax=Rubrivirga litoralis TaxID=3075598 RepID=A0ABU3BSR5_9BACT|nr:zinc-dependent metalloprotease [Rubrivirga sp. F394]MDT0632327.1 zinc-dependent metalloprotease [Rubrivirga sp. F394]